MTLYPEDPDNPESPSGRVLAADWDKCPDESARNRVRNKAVAVAQESVRGGWAIESVEVFYPDGFYDAPVPHLAYRLTVTKAGETKQTGEFLPL